MRFTLITYPCLAVPLSLPSTYIRHLTGASSVQNACLPGQCIINDRCHTLLGLSFFWYFETGAHDNITVCSVFLPQNP